MYTYFYMVNPIRVFSRCVKYMIIKVIIKPGMILLCYIYVYPKKVCNIPNSNESKP